jgi:Protein of unknown function (DUF2782)
MKLHTFLILSCLCAGAWAAEPAGKAPAPAQAPAGSNPPPAAEDHSNDMVPGEAQVTITKKDGMTVEEYRVGGRLYMIKITPKHGKPFYLVDDRGDGRFARQDPLDFGLRPPMWVIKKF